MKLAAAVLFAILTALLATVLGWSIMGALRIESVFVAGPRLSADPWGWVTILDLYLGFFLFGGYICARERSAARAVPWLVGVFCLGNLASALYVLWALHRSRYDLSSLVRPARS